MGLPSREKVLRENLRIFPEDNFYYAAAGLRKMAIVRL